MGASVRSVSSASNGDGATVVVSNPSGATTGDRLFAIQVTTVGGSSPDEPSGATGWTKHRTHLYASTLRVTTFYRDWTSGSFTFNNCTGGHDSSVMVLAIQGAGATPAGENVNTSATSSLTSGSLTASAGDCIIALAGGFPFLLSGGSLTIGYPSGMTSRGTVSQMTDDYGGSGNYTQHVSVATLDNVSAGEAGSRSWTTAADYPSWIAYDVRFPAAASTHTADASRSTTATVTAGGTVERFAAASTSTTATVTAAGTVERFGAASTTVTATTTATATRVAVADATASTTATITASAEVATPGTVAGDAAATVTAAITAAAALAQAAATASTITATITASAVIASTQTAAAAATITATVTATLVNESETTPGTIRGVNLGAATMTSVGATATTARVAMVALDVATMTAVVSTDVNASPLGVPVFAGPDDPVTLGFVTLNDAHVWFHDGIVTVREGA